MRKDKRKDWRTALFEKMSSGSANNDPGFQNPVF
jgi:hypothetical protein